MRTVRILSAVAVVVMMASIAQGVVAGDFAGEGGAIWALPWGKVTLIDLYVGLVFFAAWIAFRERRPARVAGWWLALVVTGNLGAGLYLLWAALRSSTPRELLLGSRAETG
jgi:hypothetical protein